MNLLIIVLIMVVISSALLFITIKLIDVENSVNLRLHNTDVSIDEAIHTHIKLVNPPE